VIGSRKRDLAVVKSGREHIRLIIQLRENYFISLTLL